MVTFTNICVTVKRVKSLVNLARIVPEKKHGLSMPLGGSFVITYDYIREGKG